MGADFRLFQRMMRELYRICRPGARIVINAKHPWSSTFTHDPSCVRVVSPVSLSVFDATVPAGAFPAPVAAANGVDFEIVDRQMNLAEPYLSRYANGQLPGDEAMRLTESMMNVCSDFAIELVAHKPPRKS